MDTVDKVGISQTFYCKVLTELVKNKSIDTNMTVLVVGGGPFDSNVLKYLGFSNVELTNIDVEQAKENDQINGTDLPYTDNSFDIVLAHATLHHMDKPHGCVCEMYRVATNLACFIESQDSFLMRLAVKSNLTELFESNAIRDSNYQRGGVNDLPVPNYVYRWTRREVVKLLNSLEPTHRHDIRFISDWNFSSKRVSRRLGERMKFFNNKLTFLLIDTILRIFNILFRNQGNQFAVCMRKDQRRLHNWIIEKEGNYYLNPEFSNKQIQEACKDYKHK